MPASDITFVASKLLGDMARNAGTRFPALEMLFARANTRTIPAGNVFETLAWLANPDKFRELAAAAGAIAYLGEGREPGASVWYAATPVHLHAAVDHLRLADPVHLNLQVDEAEEYATALNAYLGEDNMRLHVLDAKRWYLNAGSMPPTRTFPPHTLIEQDIYDFLPSGEGGKRLRGLTNTTQMILHTHPTNETRVSRGETAINGIWYWGGGQLPQKETRHVPVLYAAHPFGVGLWKLFDGASVAPGDASAALRTGLDSVVWFDDSMGVKSSLPLESIERDWISPALECLRKGRLHSVRFVDSGNKVLTLTRRMLRRFWRRPKPFNGQKG